MNIKYFTSEPVYSVKGQVCSTLHTVFCQLCLQQKKQKNKIRFQIIKVWLFICFLLFLPGMRLFSSGSGSVAYRSVQMCSYTLWGNAALGLSQPRRHLWSHKEECGEAAKRFQRTMGPLWCYKEEIEWMCEQVCRVGGSWCRVTRDICFSISEEEPGPLRSDAEGRNTTKVSRTFSYIKSKMYKKTRVSHSELWNECLPFFTAYRWLIFRVCLDKPWPPLHTNIHPSEQGGSAGFWRQAHSASPRYFYIHTGICFLFCRPQCGPCWTAGGYVSRFKACNFPYTDFPSRPALEFTTQFLVPIMNLWSELSSAT